MLAGSQDEQENEDGDCDQDGQQAAYAHQALTDAL